jgi:hypothetical protein
MRLRVTAGAALLVLLATGCASEDGGAGEPAGSAGRQATSAAEPPGSADRPSAESSSPPPKLLIMPSGEVLTAPPAEFMQMPVLVTYVGGPADGRTERLPLSRLRETITISGVDYRTRPGIPPELKDTPEGKAQVFRPIGN